MASNRKQKPDGQKKPKRSRASLRLDEALHARLAKAAYSIAMPVNKLVGHLLPKALDRFEREVAKYERVVGESAREVSKHFKAWLRKNPGGTFGQFAKPLLDRCWQELEPTGPAPARLLVEDTDDVVLPEDDVEAREEQRKDRARRERDAF